MMNKLPTNEMLEKLAMNKYSTKYNNLSDDQVKIVNKMYFTYEVITKI